MSSCKRNISKRETRLITILLLLLLILAGRHFSGASIYAEIKGLLEQRARLKTDTALLLLTLDQKDNINADWIRWQNDRDRLNQAIPDQKDLCGVLGKLEALLNRFDGTVHHFSIGERTDYVQYNDISLVLSVSGSTDQAQVLLHNLETFPHLLIIDSITWAASGNELVKLDLRFRLIYISTNAVEEIFN